jgi:hypothetical protein
VFEGKVTTADLLEAWREASRAAELADRLAELAHTTAERADLNAAAAEEVATLAEQVAVAATAAATRAQAAANEARQIARNSHDGAVSKAERDQTDTRAVEAQARDAYHQAEADARGRHEDERWPD